MDTLTNPDQIEIYDFLLRFPQRFVSVSEISKHVGNRRIAPSEGPVGTVVPLSIAYVDVDDASVMLANEGDRIVVARREMPDVERHLKTRRHRERRLEAGRRRELVGIHQIVVVVHRHEHLVPFHERDETPGFAQDRR